MGVNPVWTVSFFTIRLPTNYHRKKSSPARSGVIMKKWILFVIIGAITLTGCLPERAGYQLTIEIQGEGEVKPGRAGNFTKESIVEVEAVAAYGWEFKRWIGPVLEPQRSKTSVAMVQDQALKAIFTPVDGPAILNAPGGLISGRPARPQAEADIKYIMLHAISDAAVNPTNPFQIDRISTIFANYGVEAHYVIDREGKIYRYVPDHKVARHAGVGSWDNDPRFTNNMNRYAIGIELMGIGTKEEMADVIGLVSNARIKQEERGFTEEQYYALDLLLYHLRSKYQIPKENIITHQAYDPTRKWDPGVLFEWDKITNPRF